MLLGIGGIALEAVGPLSMFLLFFPVEYMEKVAEETNKKLMDEEVLTFSVFLRWLGIWLFLATTSCSNRRSFWSIAPITREEGAPYRLNDLMSSCRFEVILANIAYTDAPPPSYPDKFWEVREMIACWNMNMKLNFSPCWISCLD